MKEETQMMTTMQLAVRYGVSTRLLDQWRNYQNFPRDAISRQANCLVWDAQRVDEWLRSRKVSLYGARPRWLEVVGHPAAREDAA
jgi:hypothetical protein